MSRGLSKPNLNNLHNDAFQSITQYLDWDTLVKVLQANKSHARSVGVTLPKIMKFLGPVVLSLPAYFDLPPRDTYISFLKSPTTGEIQHLKLLTREPSYDGTSRRYDGWIRQILSHTAKLKTLEFDILELNQRHFDALIHSFVQPRGVAEVRTPQFHTLTIGTLYMENKNSSLLVQLKNLIPEVNIGIINNNYYE